MTAAHRVELASLNCELELLVSHGQIKDAPRTQYEDSRRHTLHLIHHRPVSSHPNWSRLRPTPSQRLSEAPRSGGIEVGSPSHLRLENRRQVAGGRIRRRDRLAVRFKDQHSDLTGQFYTARSHSFVRTPSPNTNFV